MINNRLFPNASGYIITNANNLVNYARFYLNSLPILNHVIQDIQMIIMNEIEIRKVQVYTGERSLTIVLPKMFSEKLNIDK
jgi:hypothetical protein